MDEKQRFKKAFDSLHASDDFEERMEEKLKSMNNRKIRRFQPAIAAAAAAAVILAGGSTAYAANLGGIQRTVQVWLHGDQTDATITYTILQDENDQTSETGVGTYILTEDQNGKVTAIQSGGGVAFNGDGTTRPATADELIDDSLNTPTTDFTGSKKLLYYKDQVIDLSNKFTDSDYYYLTIKGEDETLYVTVKKDGGTASSYDRYIQPDEFSTE